MTRLYRIDIDGANLPDPTPQMEQERRVAVFDLEESNTFRLTDGADGPYALNLSMEDRRARFDLTDRDGARAARFDVALSPLEQAMKDYLTLCETYVEAIKTLPPARIEAIDAARREIHDESARQLQGLLSGHATVDDQTARRLFTLVCTMTRLD